MSLGHYYKRIVKEIDHDDQINNSDIWYNIKSKNYKINFDYAANNKKYNIYVELNEYYPFYPPKNMLINNMNYYTFCSGNTKTMQYIQSHYDVCCLICKSYFCSANWKPCIRIKQLVEQCIHYENVINSVSKMLIIGEKYNLSHDIEKNILSYIFEKI